MAEFFYRFRSLDRLLDKGELENQEIFFSASSELNDPVEGYLDVYWTGDEILWKNLFKNYLICLAQVHLFISTQGKDFVLTNENIPVFLTVENMPSDAHRERIEKIFKSFFDNKSVSKIISNLGKNKSEVRRNELLVYLKCLHPFALNVISSVDGIGFVNPNNDAIDKMNNLLMTLEKITGVEFKSSVDQRTQFDVGKSIDDQLALMTFFKKPEMLTRNNIRFVSYEFHEGYVENLELLMYPVWYAACFSENIEDAALWGHYGEGHKGVCLMFKAEHLVGVNSGLRLSRSIPDNVTGDEAETSLKYGTKMFRFEKVIYDQKYPEIDFFKSLGQLPFPVLQKNWYTDEENNFSSSVKDVFADEEKWRANHWRSFHESSRTKLKEWAYEGEWRLVLNGPAGSLDDSQKRLFNYNFSDLSGIVFGIKTPIDLKLKILKIIEKKCDENKSYGIKFFQSEYSHASGKIKITELAALKFSPDNP